MIKNMGDIVMTTTNILEKKAKIDTLYHDEDGVWQALPADDFNESDAQVISMQNLIDLDDSIWDILSLPKGYKSIREDDKWIIKNEPNKKVMNNKEKIKRNYNK